MAEKIIISQLDIDTSLILKKNADLLDQINTMRASQKQLRKDTENLTNASLDQAESYAKTDAKLKELNGEYNRNKAVLAETTTGVKELANAIEDEVKTIKEAQDNNRKLIKIRNSLNTETEEGAKAIEMINKKLDANNSYVKSNSSALEKQKINIGNYASALDNVIPGLGSFIGKLEGTRIAMLAIPLVAIIAGLAGLFKAFTSTQSGMDKVNKVIAQGSAIMNVIIGRIGKFAGALLDFVKGDFAKGIDGIGNAFSGVGDEIVKVTEAAGKMADLEVQNRKLIRESENLIATLEIQRGVYEQIRDDATRSFEERENAALKLQETELKIANENIKIAQAQFDQIQAANEAKGTNILDDDIKAYNDAEIALKQAQAAQQAIIFNTEKERRQLVQDRLERDLDILIDGFDNQKTINEQKIADEKRTFAERQAILDETVQLSDDSFAKQIETIQKFTDQRIDANELIQTSDAVVLNERIRSLGLSEIIEGRLLEVIRDRRTAEQDLAVASSELQIKILEDQLKREADLAKKFEDAKAYAQNIKWQEELLRLEEEGASRFALRVAQLDQEHQLELDDLDRRIAAGEASERERTLIHDKYSKYRKQIDQEELNARLSATMQIAGQIANLAGKQSVLGKAASIAQATINTYQGATKALAEVPFPLNLIAAGVTTAQGLATVAKISGVSLPKFATGTERVKGSGTRTSDSVPAMLSIDERVVKANDNAKIGFNVSNSELVNGFLFYKDFLKGGSVGMSDKEIIKAMNENTKAVKQKPVPKISVIANPGTDINTRMYLS